MTGLHPRTSAPSTTVALGRALTGGLVMATALGAGTALGSAGADALGITGHAARLMPAALVTTLSVPLVLLLVRGDRRSPAWLGFGGPGASVRALLTGAGVTAAAAALVLGAGTAAGMLRWSRVEPLTLAEFLLSNGVIAFLLEALPEETTLRGYAWASLRPRFSGAVAALGTTAVFLLVPGVSTVAAAATAPLVGGEPQPMGIAPDGQRPADYLILLTIFGLTLVAARTAVGRAPLWAAIGTHLTFLTVNRIVLEGDRRHTGWDIRQTTPDAVLLVPAYLLVATAGFAVCRWRAREGRVNPGSAKDRSARRRTPVGR
ncbi:CPBP family glutamic-type intramembrane protease [Streptomyces sp. NPDC005271]|uniref:CPBP family glutamic-type intramembrane protease n=1 Tax=unclassified Streptomyces TaxID=2593676 RepID=UPI0033A0ADED